MDALDAGRGARPAFVCPDGYSGTNATARIQAPLAFSTLMGKRAILKPRRQSPILRPRCPLRLRRLQR